MSMLATKYPCKQSLLSGISMHLETDNFIIGPKMSGTGETVGPSLRRAELGHYGTFTLLLVTLLWNLSSLGVSRRKHINLKFLISSWKHSLQSSHTLREGPMGVFFYPQKMEL